MTYASEFIRSDEDHQAALKEIDRLWHATPGTPDAGHLEALAILVEDYEKKRWPIDKPTSQEARRFRREQMGLPLEEQD
ncbi:MAG: hypothetical protein JSR78_09395 [Proteobacteria bacterium]|nr:hypothetical protein [Pseudomonadota bacterium]